MLRADGLDERGQDVKAIDVTSLPWGLSRCVKVLTINDGTSTFVRHWGCSDGARSATSSAGP